MDLMDEGSLSHMAATRLTEDSEGNTRGKRAATGRPKPRATGSTAPSPRTSRRKVLIARSAAETPHRTAQQAAQPGSAAAIAAPCPLLLGDGIQMPDDESESETDTILTGSDDDDDDDQPLCFVTVSKMDSGELPQNKRRKYTDLCGAPAGLGLEDSADDTLLYIARFLPAASLVCLALACLRFAAKIFAVAPSGCAAGAGAAAAQSLVEEAARLWVAGCSRGAASWSGAGCRAAGSRAGWG